MKRNSLRLHISLRQGNRPMEVSREASTNTLHSSWEGTPMSIKLWMLKINADLFLILWDLWAWEVNSWQIIWYLYTKYQKASKKFQLQWLKASLKQEIYPFYVEYTHKLGDWWLERWKEGHDLEPLPQQHRRNPLAATANSPSPPCLVPGVVIFCLMILLPCDPNWPRNG